MALEDFLRDARVPSQPQAGSQLTRFFDMLTGRNQEEDENRILEKLGRVPTIPAGPEVPEGFEHPSAAAPRPSVEAQRPMPADVRALAIRSALDQADAMRAERERERVDRLLNLGNGDEREIEGITPRVTGRAQLAERNIANMRQGLDGPTPEELLAREQDPAFLQRRAMALGFDRTGNRSRQTVGDESALGQRIAQRAGLSSGMNEIDAPSFDEWRLNEMNVSDGGLSSVRPVSPFNVPGADEMASRRANAAGLRAMQNEMMNANRHAFNQAQAQARAAGAGQQQFLAMLNGLDPRDRARVMEQGLQSQAQMGLGMMENNRRLGELDLGREVSQANVATSILNSEFASPQQKQAAAAYLERILGGGGVPGMEAAPSGVPPMPTAESPGAMDPAAVQDWLVQLTPEQIASMPADQIPPPAILAEIISETESGAMRGIPLFGSSEAEFQIRSRAYNNARAMLERLNIPVGPHASQTVERNRESYSGMDFGAPMG